MRDWSSYRKLESSCCLLSSCFRIHGPDIGSVWLTVCYVASSQVMVVIVLIFSGSPSNFPGREACRCEAPSVRRQSQKERDPTDPTDGILMETGWKRLQIASLAAFGGQLASTEYQVRAFPRFRGSKVV